MNELHQIEVILNNMEFLLKDCNLLDWSKIFSRLSNHIKSDPQNTLYQIVMLYGGMGSLNDIVLSKNGEILKDENDRFDMLRNSLYELLSNPTVRNI